MKKEAFEKWLIELSNQQVDEVYLSPGTYPFIKKSGKTMPLQEEEKIESTYTEEILDLVLLAKEKEKFEKEGHFEVAYSIEKVGRYRIRFGKQRSSITIMLHVKSLNIPKPEALRIPEQVCQLFNEKTGLFLICGDKKSGKAQTAAALLQYEINHKPIIIATVENSIDYLISHGNGIINQMEVGMDISDMSTGLKEGINNYSDLIYLNELSGQEMIKNVMEEIEKGVSIVACVDAISVEGALHKIIYSFNQDKQFYVRFLLSKYLKGIICEKYVNTTEDALIPVFEVLIVNQAVQKMLAENKLSQLNELFDSYEKHGIVSMDQAVLQLLKEGIITKDEAYQQIKDKQRLLVRA